MNLEDEVIGGTTVIHVYASHLDAANAADFRAGIAGLVGEGVPRLILDLREVSFLDSSGLGAIISTLKRTGGAVTLVIGPEQTQVREVLQLTRLDRVFGIAGSVEEAATPRSNGG